MTENSDADAVACARSVDETAPAASRLEAGLTGIITALSGLVRCMCCYYALRGARAPGVGTFTNAQINTTFYPALLAGVAITVKGRSWVDRLAVRARQQGRRTDPRNGSTFVPIWPNLAMLGGIIYCAMFGPWSGDALTSPIFPAAERTAVMNALLYTDGVLAALLIVAGIAVAMDELGLGGQGNLPVHDAVFYLQAAGYAPTSVILFVGNRGFLFGIGYLLGGLAMLSLLVASRGYLSEEIKSEATDNKVEDP